MREVRPGENQNLGGLRGPKIPRRLITMEGGLQERHRVLPEVRNRGSSPRTFSETKCQDREQAHHR